MGYVFDFTFPVSLFCQQITKLVPMYVKTTIQFKLE